MTDISKEVDWVVANWDSIHETFKDNLRKDRYDEVTMVSIPGIPEDEHEVVVLIRRQRPSVSASWDFNMECICITRTGRVIWGFDSGCSCPSPWIDSHPDCYSCANSWSEFVLDTKNFDEDWAEACLRRIEDMKKCIEAV